MSPKMIHFVTILELKMSPFCGPIWSEKEIFLDPKWSHFRDRKTNFEAEKEIENSFSSRKRNLKFHFGPEKKIQFWSKLKPKWPHFEAILLKIGPFWAKISLFWSNFFEIGDISSKPARFRSKSSKPARKCWLASLACAFSRLVSWLTNRGGA